MAYTFWICTASFRRTPTSTLTAYQIDSGFSNLTVGITQRKISKEITFVKNLHWRKKLKVLQVIYYFWLQLHPDYLNFLWISSGESSAYFCLIYLSLYRQHQMSSNMIQSQIHNHKTNGANRTIWTSEFLNYKYKSEQLRQQDLERDGWNSSRVLQQQKIQIKGVR